MPECLHFNTITLFLSLKAGLISRISFHFGADPDFDPDSHFLTEFLPFRDRPIISFLVPISVRNEHSSWQMSRRGEGFCIPSALFIGAATYSMAPPICISRKRTVPLVLVWFRLGPRYVNWI